MRLMFRRPKTRSLAALYDAGAKALATGEECPYEPADKRGDEIRSWLWKQGREDADNKRAVEALL